MLTTINHRVLSHNQNKVKKTVTVCISYGTHKSEKHWSFRFFEGSIHRLSIQLTVTSIVRSSTPGYYYESTCYSLSTIIRVVLIQWNLSITTTLWDTYLPFGAHLVTFGICFKQHFDTRYLVLYNTSPPRMFLSLDLLWEYRIQHGANGPLYVTSNYSTWIFCRGFSGFATDCPCGVWCRGLTTCPLHVGPPFENRILNSWAVGLT